MKNFKFLCITILIFSIQSLRGQNLPSLLTGKNINATFSILAYDPQVQEWGIAVATDNIYVGNSTIYIEPGVGGFSVIADTEPRYGIEGLRSLKEGKSIEHAITAVKKMDEDSNHRQVSGVDAEGNVYAFTGKSLKYWKGKAAVQLGKNFVVMGNQLADGVLSEMAHAYENSEGTLAERLLKSLIAGQAAGGQISGKQSAAIVVKGSHNEWYNQIDLRVDNAKAPFSELETLMNYHYGRIRLNQAHYAHRSGNLERARKKLAEAENMLDGWTGMYARIAKVNMVMGNEIAAIKWVKKGLSENPSWSINLPAFYFLHDHPEMKPLIVPDAYTTTDWESALGMLSNLGREQELISLCNRLFYKGLESSYMHFLIGRSYYYEKEEDKAIEHLEKALAMDEDNVEAENLLVKIKSN